MYNSMTYAICDVNYEKNIQLRIIKLLYKKIKR